MVLPFVAITVGMLVRQIAVDFTADIAKKQLAQSYLVKRMDKKLKKKFGKSFLSNRLSDTDLDSVRSVLKEELSSYGIKEPKEVDSLIVNSLSKLSDEHRIILAKLDNIETLIQKISIPLSFQISKDRGEILPPEMLEGLIEGKIKGNASSKSTFNELINDGEIPSSASEILDKWNFIEQMINYEQSRLESLFKRFTGSSDDINNLHNYLEIGSILDIAESLSATDALLTRIINEGLRSPEIEKSVISFCLIMDRLGRLSKLSEKEKKIMADFLLKRLNSDILANEKIETYFLLEKLGFSDYVDLNTILEIFEHFSKQKYQTTKDMKSQVKISVKVARFLKKIGMKKPPKTSIRTVKSLVTKLDKRKFSRKTSLLLLQLDRLYTELNLLIAYFEKDNNDQVDIQDLSAFLQLLITIVNRPEALNLDNEVLERIIKLQDSTLYLYDLLAVRNSRNVLNKYEINIRSMYSSTLGKYRRISDEHEEVNKIIAQMKIKAKTSIASNLPSPPKHTPNVKEKGKAKKDKN